MAGRAKLMPVRQRLLLLSLLPSTTDSACPVNLPPPAPLLLCPSAVLLMRYARRHSGRSPRLLVGLERRICFTMTDQAVRAPAYDFWRTLFQAVAPPAQDAAAAGGAAAAAESGLAAAEPRAGAGEQQHQRQHQQARAGSQLAGQPWSGGPLVAAGSAQQPPFPLVGCQIHLATIPQALHPYERSEYLELWELELRD